ncbi:MAG: hypothetical protein JXR77_18935 [Lentisphaeria bacterium]|nr:hypothetical protein [Lentisphaeria bacterium]
MRYWKPEDICAVLCPFCGHEMEFWRDEPTRLCPSCGMAVRNPRINLACAAWCRHAAECLGKAVDRHVAAIPVIEKVRAYLHGLRDTRPEDVALAETAADFADTLLAVAEADPGVVKAGAAFAALAASHATPGDRGPEAVHPDTRAMHALLAPVVGDSDILAHLDAVVSAARGGPPCETPEGALVSDAVNLARLRHGRTASSPPRDPLVFPMRTPAGRRLAARCRE